MTSTQVKNSVQSPLADNKPHSGFDLEEIKQILTCEICKDIFNEPVTLICNHTYCHSCLSQLIKGSKNNQLPISEPICPKCQVKIWIPPRKQVNFVLRDLIKSLYGDEAYEKAYKDRAPNLIKDDIKDKVVEEIKNEMWRSISDTLKFKAPPLDDFSNHNTSPSVGLGPGMGYTNHFGKPPCSYFNSVEGCGQEAICPLGHVKDPNMLYNSIVNLREAYPFLRYHHLGNVCRQYNSLDGCQLGDKCPFKHHPDPDMLMEEIAQLRKEYEEGKLCNKQCFNNKDDFLSGYDFTKKMAVIVVLLISAYLWWKMKQSYGL